MHRFRYLWCTIIILEFCLISHDSWAEKAYVTDSIDITLRIAPGSHRKIISMLSTGQPLEVLESEDGWSRVRLLGNGQDKNEEGWVLSRFLMTRPPWETRFKALLEEKQVEADQREKERESKLQETTKALGELEKQHESLSTDYLTVKASHLSDASKLETVQKDFEDLSEEYNKLKYSEWKNWFASGAGVLFFGLMIGLIFGIKLKKRKLSAY